MPISSLVVGETAEFAGLWRTSCALRRADRERQSSVSVKVLEIVIKYV